MFGENLKDNIIHASKCGPGLPALAHEVKTTRTLTRTIIMTMPLSQIVFFAMWKSFFLSITVPQEVRVDALIISPINF